MKKLSFLVILLLLFSQYGCWNRKELNDILIVQAIGIDKLKNGDFHLTYQVLKPKVLKNPSNIPSSSQQKGVWCFSSTGKTMSDAIRNATLLSNKKLFFSHNKIVVVSESLAKKGIKETLDVILRDHEFRSDAYLIITSDNIEKLLNISSPIESIPAKELENVIKNYYANSKTIPTKIYEFVKMTNTKSKVAIAPFVEIKKATSTPSDNSTFFASKTAVFKNFKLVGYLDHNQTRGALWGLNKIRSGIYPIKNKSVSLELIHNSSKVSVKKEKNKVLFKIEISSEVNLSEKQKELQLTQKNIEEVKKEFSKSVSKDINQVLKTSFELKADILHLQDIYYAKYKENLKFDKEIIVVSINVKPFIRRFGMLKN